MDLDIPSRRQFLAGSSAGMATIAGATFFTGLNGRKWGLSSNDHSSVVPGGTVGLEPIADGFEQPVALETPIDDHVYVADKVGRIHLLSQGMTRNELVLDLADEVVLNHGEQGLLGLEFDPAFESNKRLYVRYSSPPRSETPEGYSHTFVLSEFEATDDYRDIKSDSERPILEVPEPGRMHNAGSIEFGPDGFLYVTIGDGGGDGHDGSGPLNRGPNNHAGDWYMTNVGGNGQNVTDNLLGSVLRIDVNDRDSDEPYSIPDGNPLVSEKGLGEHYAWGFRNPYSMSFDDEDLYVGDVGTRLFEEVNLVEKGGNYGWNVKEGETCHNNFPPLRGLSVVGIDARTIPMCPNATPKGQELKDPVILYPHTEGIAVIGGQVYRGSEVPGLQGQYIFGDLTGRLFASTPASPDDYWTIEELAIMDAESSEARKSMGRSLLSLEAGSNGELFALTVGESGEIHQITPPEAES